MSELRKNENFEEEAQKPELCNNCHEFFGNKTCEGLCSSCFRAKLNNASTNPLTPQATTLLSQANSLSNQLQEKLNSANKEVKAPVEEAKEEKVVQVEQQVPKPEETTGKQKDTSRCFQCNKKVGLLGFKCQCESTFCRNHRLPESHVCDFDFTKAGKEKLAKQNIQVKADKIERI